METLPQTEDGLKSAVINFGVPIIVSAEVKLGLSPAIAEGTFDELKLTDPDVIECLGYGDTVRAVLVIEREGGCLFTLRPIPFTRVDEDKPRVRKFVLTPLENSPNSSEYEVKELVPIYPKSNIARRRAITGLKEVKEEVAQGLCQTIYDVVQVAKPPTIGY